MRGLATETAAQFFGIAKLFVVEDASGANVLEGSCQLVVMGVAPRQTVIIDKEGTVRKVFIGTSPEILRQIRQSENEREE